MIARAGDSHEHAAQEIETAALRDLHDAADDALRWQLGLDWQESGGALASIAGGDPSILLNRTTGIGVSEPATPQQVHEIVSAYRDADIARFFVQHHPRATPPEVVEWLATTGLVRQRAWMKFRHDLVSLPDTPAGLSPEPIDAGAAREFGAIVADGFDLKPETGELLSRLVGRTGWHPFMVRIEGDIAGVAALLIRDDTGWCDWAATRPAFRGRGIQRALLAARLELAKRNRCHAVFTTTGAAVPGDAQHSYRNILNAGFQELYFSDNYAPPRPE